MKKRIISKRVANTAFEELQPHEFQFKLVDDEGNTLEGGTLIDPAIQI